MRELIHEMNPWWEKELEFVGVKRPKYLSFLEKNTGNKEVILITGLRRVGKSTILKQYIYQLIRTKQISPQKICYLSLDAYLFNDYSIIELVREFRKINNLGIDEKIYLFLDEVTAKESFKQELKNLYDLGQTKIFASSSSASLLIDKKAYLTGRSRLLIVEPLDFDEFLLFKQLSPKKSEGYLLESHFKKYLELGGLPEYVLTEDPTYITNLVNNIIYKDIIAFHNIKNITLVIDLFRLLCERVGKQVSYNKLSHVLNTTKDTIKKYIGYFVDSYLFSIIEKDAKSMNERVADNKKIYCADVGIKNVTVGFRDLGAIYENLVFLRIKHKNPRYFKKDGLEIDFRFDQYLIEAKYNSKLNPKQAKLFESIKIKNKIVAQGVDFFTEELEIEKFLG